MRYILTFLLMGPILLCLWMLMAICATRERSIDHKERIEALERRVYMHGDY